MVRPSTFASAFETIPIPVKQRGVVAKEAHIVALPSISFFAPLRQDLMPLRVVSRLFSLSFIQHYLPTGAGIPLSHPRLLSPFLLNYVGGEVEDKRIPADSACVSALHISCAV